MKFIRLAVLAVSSLTLGTLALTPNLGHGSESFQQGYDDGAKAGRRAAQETASNNETQTGGGGCCGGQQQPSSSGQQ
ncbi:MAG: hypothetical protein ABIJ96_08915 [Elusimicrobiota bacterium]